MMSRRVFPARRAAWGSALFALLLGGRALAADAPGEGESSESAARDATSEVEAREPTAETPPASAPNESVSSVGLERLRGTAYPEPRVRGIAGGSLWLTMQGHQWPYMPRRAGDPDTRIGFSGSAWVDTSYQKVDSGLPETDPSIKEWRQQSRLVLRATPTYDVENGYFVQGQGELVLVGAAPTRTEDLIVADDLYVRTGKWNVFDVTVGRFQGWELYHLGMGLDLNTVERNGARTEFNRPVDLYGLTYLWDRPNGPGRIAAHYYATDYLRFELLGQVGSSALNVLGARPVGILDIGVLKVKLGAEYMRETPRQQAADRKDKVLSRGVAGALQVVIDPVLEAGVSLAHSLVDTYNVQGNLDAARSTTTTSYGAFANLRVAGSLIVGGGANYTHEHNLKLDVTGKLNDVRTHLQVFGAAQYLLWDQLFIKGVLAYANADFDPQSNPPPVAEFRNEMLSGRLRLMYLF
jgi:hypothetical protein